ncbi:MAG: LCP family protein [Nocardioides sp.]|uniref:LCP family protein n=1 Tax=Nocardioides sp. TaxID=35761 RepID=UPI003F0B68A2
MSEATSTPEDPTSPPEWSRRGRRAKRRSTPRRVGRVVGYAVLAFALVAALSGVYGYRQLSAKIKDPDYDFVEPRPENTGPKGAIDILVMGQDTRAGDNKIDGEEGGGVSDTTILVHLSADRERAYGISIPRDTMVARPDCKDPDSGETIPGSDSIIWNDAFKAGGPACTIAQFEQLTGIRLEYTVVLDFAGFKEMVDAVDGVPICVPTYIHDPKTGITLEPGTREVAGDRALDYVRIRSGFDEYGERVLDGSDTGRIKRQQVFIAALAKKVVSAQTLSNPKKVYDLLNAFIESVELTGVDNLMDLAGLGYQFRGIGMDKIKFVTAPWQLDPADPNRVVLLPEAEDVWQRILDDQPLTKEQLADSTSASKAPGGTGKDGGKKTGTQTPDPGTTTHTPETDPEVDPELLRYGICG